MTDVPFMDREPSFSLVYFTGDVYGHMPEFLKDCNYAVLAERYVQAPFPELFDSIGDIEGLDNSIVYKATYKVPGGTILLDPEMVIRGRTEELIRFCSKHLVEAFAAIWERYSETVDGRHLSRNGLHSDFTLMSGEFPEPPVNPPADLMSREGADAIKAFLASGGAPLEAVFGTISAWVFRLGPPLVSDRQ
jgi:hypothetical protein